MISFGIDFVAGKNRVPKPATGNTALVTFSPSYPIPSFQRLLAKIKHYPATVNREFGQIMTLTPHMVIISTQP
jgi:hypothetical protein